MESVIALAILGISLTVLLTTQAASMGNAARARDLTLASLLARSKMIDIERYLFDEGFTEGDVSESGQFGDEGHEEISWKYTVSEIEMDIGSLDALCSLLGGGEGDQGGEFGCEEMLSGLGGLFDGFMNDFGRSMRLVELVVTWPVGHRYSDSMTVRALMTENLQLRQGGLPGAESPATLTPGTSTPGAAAQGGGG
ncbi:MAG: hypothetical protein R3C68_13840 [Myxococcota bacterium]